MKYPRKVITITVSWVETGGVRGNHLKITLSKNLPSTLELTATNQCQSQRSTGTRQDSFKG